MKMFRQSAMVAAVGLMLTTGTAFAGFDTIRPDDPQPNNRGELPPGVKPQLLDGVGIDEHLNAPVDLNLQFIDETGYPVKLASFFHKDRPVILDLVYYTCPMLCNLILNGQVDAMKEVAGTPGNDYEVVTISINPEEGFDLAKHKKETYLGIYGRSAPGWHFLADYHGNVKKLADEAGFHYRYDPGQQQYAHASAIMVLTPEGKMARYLYGIRFKPLDLRLALSEASQGRSMPTVDKILLWCYHYDPAANSYVLFAQNFMKVGGALSVLILGFFVWRLFRAEKLRAARLGTVRRERTA